MDRRALFAVGGVVGLFVLVQFGALALVEPFKQAGYQPVEDPSDPTNSILYVLVILVATAGMLAAIKLGVEQAIRALVIGSGGFLAYYVFSVLLPPLGGGTVHLPAVLGGIVLAGALLVYPEWYVIDAAGVVMGAGAAALFGIGFGPLPALILLVVLAVYDAISVYGTEHMLTLASGVMDLRIPVILVVPLSLSYSFLDAEMPETTTEHDPDDPDDSGNPAEEEPSERALERDAFFIGLGDAVIPTILVASAGFFGSAPSLGVPGIALTLPALTTIVGILAGLLALMWMVMAGRAHAGLPLLNGGAITGYLIGAVAAGIPLVEAVGLARFL